MEDSPFFLKDKVGLVLSKLGVVGMLQVVGICCMLLPSSACKKVVCSKRSEEDGLGHAPIQRD